MSNAHTPAKRKGARHGADFARRPMPDGAAWIALLLIGAFAVALTTAAFGWPWRQAAAGYLIAVLFLVNLSAWRAYGGRELAGWQQALARLPLRFAGFGTPVGRPLGAASGDRRALTAILVAFLMSAAIAAGLIYWVSR